MAEFVNYKKRSVTLPSGCKNLGDLLHPHVPPQQIISTPAIGSTAPSKALIEIRNDSVAGGLLDIWKFVALVFESRAPSSSMLTISPEADSVVNVRRDASSKLSASIEIPGGRATLETAVRSFLTHHRLFILPDFGLPPHFSPNLPWQSAFDLSPLLTESRIFSRILTDLFCEAFGLTVDSTVSFHYFEFKYAD